MLWNIIVYSIRFVLMVHNQTFPDYVISECVDDTTSLFTLDIWSLELRWIEINVQTSFCSYARPAQPGPNRTRLCGPCIATIAGD